MVVDVALSDLDDQSTRLRRVADLLWPPEDHDRQVTRHRGAAAGDYLVLPRASRPRLLVPAEPSAARASIEHSSTGSSPRARRVRQLAAVAAGAGLHRFLPLDHLQVRPTTGDDRSFLAHVADVSGLPVTWLALRLGAARPNQKPVVLLGTAGSNRPLAFAKIAWNPLTSHLVAHEGATLDGDGIPRGGVVRAPALHHHGSWQDHPLIVIEALPVPSTSTSVSDRRIVEVMADVAGTGPQDADVPLAGWVDRHLAERVAPHQARRGHDRLAGAVERLRDDDGDTGLATGSWHGDFRPWNMAADADRVLLWDWERHAHHRPVGLDAIHLHFPIPSPDDDPAAFRARADTGAAASAVLLPGLGVDPANRRVLRALHTVELVLREFDDVAVQADMTRPHHLDHLLTYLESLT